MKKRKIVSSSNDDVKISGRYSVENFKVAKSGTFNQIFAPARREVANSSQNTLQKFHAKHNSRNRDEVTRAMARKKMKLSS